MALSAGSFHSFISERWMAVRQASDQATTPRQSGPADPAAYVREFWDGPLRAGDAGTDIAQLWNAFDADATAARSQYGRQAGLGGAWYFCIRGQGTVETVEKDRVVLTVTDSSRRVCLELGVVVDNTVREAIGVKASDFANSQDFNAVSSELNRRAEQEGHCTQSSIPERRRGRRFRRLCKDWRQVRP